VKQAPLTVRRWTRVEYDRLVELGAFDREPLELIGGAAARVDRQRPVVRIARRRIRA
jgi:hypothetical protein